MDEPGRKRARPLSHRSAPLPRAPISVGFLIDRWSETRGGAERALFALARRLAEHGLCVRAFAREGDGGDDGEAGPESNSRENGNAREEAVAARRRAAGTIPLVRVAVPWRMMRGAREVELARALSAAADAAGCDVTIGARHLERVDILWLHGGAHAASLHARREARARRELPRASVPAWSRHRAFLDLERAALDGGARRVVCVSELARVELEREHPSARARIVTVENGVDLERFHPRERARSGAALRRELEIDPATPLIACAARDPRLKGAETAFAALARLVSRPWTFVLAGPRRVRAWERLASQSGFGAGRVRVLEHVDAQALSSAADLALLPTWRDTCGLFVLEALACGTPVITTARAGASVHVRDGASGTVLARPGDVEALERALTDWLDRIARGEVDRARVRHAVEGCGEERWLAALEALVREVAAEKDA